MPTEPAALRDELCRRRLAMLGAFVTTRLADPRLHEASRQTAVDDRAAARGSRRDGAAR